jgi:hypothetical protein
MIKNQSFDTKNLTTIRTKIKQPVCEKRSDLPVLCCGECLKPNFVFQWQTTLPSVGSNDGRRVFFFSDEITSGRVIRPYGSLEPESRVGSKVPTAQDGAPMVYKVDKNYAFALADRPRIVAI